jgi:hypothetical protein
MDYLDPKKEARHRLTLFAGYACIAVAIALTTLVLLYQAYGFGVTKNGDVTQNGLAFFSSQPSPANIVINGKPSKYSTNTRIAMLSGIYKIELVRDGYRNWQRTIEIDGGSVQHFDYPFLIPNDLRDKKIQSFAAAPALSTQSPDRRWLVIAQPNSFTSFEVFDLKSPEKAPTSITLPDNVLTKAAAAQSLELVSWASDNDHILLRHNYDGKIEYVLIERSAPEKSVNLNTTLSATPSKLTLSDKKYDKYHLMTGGNLQTASLSEPNPVTIEQHVLAYQTYGEDTVLYATDADVAAGKVAIRLATGGKTYTVRTFPAGSTYLLDLTKYSDVLYVAAGSSNLNKVYIYKDPAGQLNSKPKQAPVPTQVLRVNAPNYLSFSNSAQFIMAQNGSQYGVYDFENKRGYNYTAAEPLDAPATHATWMDGNRLTYVSNGQTLIFDFDHTNPQKLQSASSAYLPAFSPDYKFVYTLRGATAPQIDLMQTSLRTAADQ